MAHKLVHKQLYEEALRAIRGSPERSASSGDKDRLNRRSFVTGGAAVAAALLAPGGGLAYDSSGEERAVYTTDFAEYGV